MFDLYLLSAIISSFTKILSINELLKWCNAMNSFLRFGPVCCFSLLTLATTYFTSNAYANINLISAVICILFYAVGTAALTAVSCSDPGIVKRDSALTEVSASKGWRYCDLCR
jgi:hypothetical protein